MKSRLILVLLIATLAATLIAVKQSSQKPERLPKETLDEKLLRLPVTDLTASDIADPEKKRLRQIRNAKHNSEAGPDGQKRAVLSERLETVVLDLPLTTHAEEPALPIDQSDVVIVGRVTNVNAYISEDKTTVYSEATVKVEEVLTGESPIQPGDVVTTTRDGGAVRLPSGKILRRGRLGRNIPEASRTYLFFLDYLDEIKDFSIITAYELSEGVVTPLDGTITIHRGGRFTLFRGYESYAGQAASILLADVRAAISKKSK